MTLNQDAPQMEPEAPRPQERPTPPVRQSGQPAPGSSAPGAGAAGTERRRTSRVVRSTTPTRAVHGPRPEPATAGAPGVGARLSHWLLKGQPQEPGGFYEPETSAHKTHPWYKVMCLTGVDYFSTLGYQPGIAALAAGALSPIATLVLVLITLFGALPMYRRVAEESPHGDGSISMLERLLDWWKGKLFVLCLIGFVATGFVITITLSAADATAHLAENPFTRFVHGYEVVVTLALIVTLGAVFLKGFGEAIGVAVVLVIAYLSLNVVVLGVGIFEIVRRPEVLSAWTGGLFASYGNPLAMVGAALLVFPRLALGLSGFETGVVVMPLVKGDPGDTPERPAGRIRHTHTLLTVAAVIMSVLLLASAVVTTVLIPHAAFEEDGAANGRALAYLAHEYLGNGFGTAYDISTILILWFAGASAMAGLLNIVPRYLPRYGMAPNWARATRPLVLIFTAICSVVTILFRANVEAQAGAYATGVLALMTSATVAVTLSAYHRGQRMMTGVFGVISAIFVYTTAVTVFGQPDGLKIAALFILAIVVSSIVSRLLRQTELRVRNVVLDGTARRFIDEAARGNIRIIAHDTDLVSEEHYAEKEASQRHCNHMPDDDPVLFFEVTVLDASEFAPDLVVSGHMIGPHRVLRAQSAAVPNAIAAFLLFVRTATNKQPHAYFEWSEGNPFGHLARYVLVGEGDIAPITHEILRQAEPIPERRPVCHVA